METGTGFIQRNNSEEVRGQYTSCKGGQVEAGAISVILEL